MLKNVKAGPLKSAIIVVFSINLVLAFEVSRAVDSSFPSTKPTNRSHTYLSQVMLIPPREYVERWLVKPSRPYYRLLPSKWQRNLTRTLLVLVTFGPSPFAPLPYGEPSSYATRAQTLLCYTIPSSAVAFSLKNFGLLTGFVGAITDTLQGFVLPPLIYAAAHKATLPQPERAALAAMSLLGVCLMLTATYQNFGVLVRQAAPHHHPG